MPKKSTVGLFTEFKGLWQRGPRDNTPPDHIIDGINTVTGKDYNLEARSGSGLYAATNNITRMAIYKPNPPFTATNYPRIIYLRNNQDIFDIKFPGAPIYTHVNMFDFSLVNFFGRCYISPSDGKVGLSGVNVKLYDGSGAAVRDAGGTAPAVAMTANLILGSGGNLTPTLVYLLSYAFETSSGFVTQPAPFIAIQALGGATINVTALPVGPAGTVARWVIATKGAPGGTTAAKAPFLPQFFQQRIGDNVTTTIPLLTFFDESLVDEADYLQTQLQTIPSGVGLMEYKGRMVSHGEFANPSLVRVSEPGEPEAFSSTSGFLVTDPTDSSGVRAAVEYRDNLYFYKDSRGYVTQEEPGTEASQWRVVNFEKAVGTEHLGIVQILDAKGSSSEGFIIAGRGALYYFNGVLQEPELSYKIKNLWNRINKVTFDRVQVAQDPLNKRLYILVPLDGATVPNYIIFGDYSEGLDPFNIKWHLWQLTATFPANSILIYEEFVNNVFNYATRYSSLAGIYDINLSGHATDAGADINFTVLLGPMRWSTGLSQSGLVRVRALGPANLGLTMVNLDSTVLQPIETVVVPNSTPGREYAVLSNMISEQIMLLIYGVSNNVTQLALNAVQIEGQPYGDERPS